GIDRRRDERVPGVQPFTHAWWKRAVKDWGPGGDSTLHTCAEGRVPVKDWGPSGDLKLHARARGCICNGLGPSAGAHSGPFHGSMPFRRRPAGPTKGKRSKAAASKTRPPARPPARPPPRPPPRPPARP